MTTTPGQRIRELRKAKELSQPQLAEAVGINQSTLSDIERGSGFSADILMRLADELGAPADFLMRGSSGAWPFKRVSLQRILALSPSDLAYLEGRLESALETVEQSQGDLRQNPSAAVKKKPLGRLPGEIDLLAPAKAGGSNAVAVNRSRGGSKTRGGKRA